MKKIIVSLSIIAIFLLIVGCLDYKTYDSSQDNPSEEELQLIDEIANIEKQLDSDNGNTEDIVEEEVVLPELDENNEALVNNEDTQQIVVKENDWVKLKVRITDPDEDEVSYTFTKPLNENGEWKTNYGDAGEYIVTLSATDGQLTTEKKIKIVVERVNVAPIISGIKDIIVNEGQTVNFEPVVNDPNNDPVTVTISEPLKSGSFVTDHTSAGEYMIKVVASDGELETEKSFKLTVNNVNELPVITGLEDIVVKEGEVVKIQPEVSDLDEDEIALTISEPVGNDGIWETGYTDNGNYVVTVVADDGKDQVTKKVKVTVEDVNMPPEIVEVSLNVN